jgi:fructokinase
MRFGIDLGGTKIEIIALDDQGQEILRRRIDTPHDQYELIIEALTGLVTDAERELSCRGTVGIGMPGAISPATGLIKNANTVCLNGRTLQRDVEAALQREVRLCNDANCFALSEATDGAAAKARVVFGVILGTGVGGGLVVNSHVLTGPNAIAGEWGHNPLPWPQTDELPGLPCYCGKFGCIETFCSGPGFSLAFHQKTGLTKTAKEIFASPDAASLTLIELYYDRLARALASVINIVDPDVIVLGGGLSQVNSLYQEVPARWGRYVFSDRVDTKLVQAKFGDSSGVRGAAWLW